MLEQFPEGLSLSRLKNKILEIDSSFDERTLGFSGFMKFLENVPEIVSLYKVNQTWYAQPLSTKSNRHLLDAHQDTAGSDLITPTTDLYRRLLIKSGWRS
ncbi:OST-HTH/LOTUS domain-containing protein [Trichothermofontia sichuanensis]|uniref:OST-HTH/LOTUS domain-containing protein n=1 Tax=Trichothermofontia sichuanensis TaxID=3045816 RepID=UPI0028F3FB10|nr:OST-HTH/LOTUS domain-containing protein [Trichothermofontia sichuanensis]